MKIFHDVERVFLIIGLVLLFVGCQYFPRITEEPEPVLETPVLGSYLDFEDVQVPRGLKLDRKRSYVYQTESLKTGVLSFDSTRSAVEIVEEFEENMPRDNWILVSNFKFHKNILLYNKAAKNCLIIVEAKPNRGWVRVEIWLSPARAGEERDSAVTRLLDKRKETP
ncbi:MAG: hypothetical protein JRD68_10435 [Deltaproteobacteria bacterium]|nr:hypothetical protein [Deltaproteobacteria bacterium]